MIEVLAAEDDQFLRSDLPFCRCFPRILPVIQVPLVHQSNYALVRTPGQDETFRLSVGKRQPIIDHRSPDFWFGILHAQALEFPHQHRPIIKSFFIGDFFSLCQLLQVLLGLDLHLLDESRRGHFPICRRADDGHRIDGGPVRFDLVKFGLFAQVGQRCEVIWRVRWDGCDNTGSLD